MDEERKINVALYPRDHAILRARAERGQSLADILHAALVAAGWTTDEEAESK